MALVRETIYEALKAQLAPLKPGTIITLERFWKSWDRVEAVAQPAVFLVPHQENTMQEKGSPPILTINADAMIYTSRGSIEDISAETALNGVMDAIDGRLAPDAVTGFQTLGGLVAHTWNPGPNQINPAAESDQAVAIYPISMLVTANNLPGQQQMIFDAGYLYAIPNDRPDGTATNKTPIRLGAFKGINISMATDHVYPDSQFQYRLNANTTGREISGTARVGWINGYIWNQIIFGEELVAGNRIAKLHEAKTVPASPGPYTITPTPPDSGTYVQDMGVVYSATGLPLKAVTAVSEAGEYSQSAGTYTFHSGDAETAVAISYLYDLTTGTKIAVTNSFMGPSASFELILVGLYNGKQMTVILHKCIMELVTIPGTIEQFYIYDFSFQAIADGSGKIATISMA